MMRVGRAGLAALIVTALGAGSAALPTRTSAQQAHVLAVTGLGGSPEYTARFAGWGARLVEAALGAGVAPERVVWLAEREDVHARASGAARAEAVRSELSRIASASSPGDLVLVALFGHGSARGGEASLNLPGPDLSAAELATGLDLLDGRRVVVVNAASASGGWVPVLSAEGRVVITATRTAGEAEATRFGGYFVDALAGDVADTDKDGVVSVLEAFEYARLEVARSFAASGHLPTEHALIDDDGDGRGSLEPAGPEGELAATLALGGGAATGAVAGDAAEAADPVLRSLLEEKRRLEAELTELRARRDRMEEAEYERELERLLLEVARNGQAIRERQGGGDD